MSFESVDLIVQIDWALDLPMIDELIPPRRKVQKSIKKRKKNCSFAHNFTLTTIVETPMSVLKNRYRDIVFTIKGPYVWSLRVYRQL